MLNIICRLFIKLNCKPDVSCGSVAGFIFCAPIICKKWDMCSLSITPMPVTVMFCAWNLCWTLVITPTLLPYDWVLRHSVLINQRLLWRTYLWSLKRIAAIETSQWSIQACVCMCVCAYKTNNIYHNYWWKAGGVHGYSRISSSKISAFESRKE